MRKNNLLKFVVCALSILCLIFGLLWKQKSKEKSAVKIEVQAKGKFDKIGRVFIFTEVSTGEVMTIDKGIYLIGDTRFYKVPNTSQLNLSRGDSVYVVNGKAYATMPSKAELTTEIQEIEDFARKGFGISCLLLVGVLGGIIIWGTAFRIRR